eukprot:CAMPEP_0171062740 /NCGR_PEP_ID=MMETSP0766_2-20121228/5214_1 /TAXON_ID=439317 /ORGANISM="Gambierdiscus australes, Strain CAWD 149" /LENGTH=354 /DNA_ID=CAMNT_0011518549 /DNA_START=40 /DNA_END=1104 /DNA_ORIENTATION=+
MSPLLFKSVSEVEEYCRSEDKQFVVYHRSVLDVAGFKHPGPQTLIQGNIGKDITQDFNGRKHSDFAKELCERLTVGYIGSPLQAGELLAKSYSTMDEEEIEIHKHLDKTLDMKKPLVPQVRRMSNKEFMAFVRRPRFIDDIDGIVLFESNDEASKRPFRHNFMIGIPASTVCLWMSFTYSATGLEFFLNFGLYFVILGAGVFWVLIEYVFHRFLLHRELELDPAAPADGDRLARLFSDHLHHHVFMNQWFRTTISVRAFRFYGPIIFLLLVVLVPRSAAFMTFAGIAVGSLLYDSMHLAFHHGPDIEFCWFRKMKAAHMRHHFRDNHNEFGVTSPLFDMVFGTSGTPSSTAKDK